MRKLVFLNSLLLSVLLTFFLLTGSYAQATDWTAAYDLDEPSYLPESFNNKLLDINPSSMVAADLYLNLSEVLSMQEIGVEQPATIVIVADTIEIPNDFILNLKNQSLIIFSRRIVGSGRGTLSLDGADDSTVMVGAFIDEVSANLKVISFFPDNSFELDTITSNETNLGQLITVNNGQHNRSLFNGDITGYMQLNPQAYEDVFNKIFDMASSIHDQNPTLSIKMLTWLEKNLRTASGMRQSNTFLANLYLQAANFKQFVEFSTQGDNFVPYLDSSLYETTYTTYLDTMKDYQDQYERFMDQGANVQTRKIEAENMLANLNDSIAAEDAIIENAEDSIKQLETSLSNIEDQLKDQEVSVFSAKSSFLIGLEEWERQQALDTAFQVFSSLSSLGSSIALAVTGNMIALNQLADDIPVTAIEGTEVAKAIQEFAWVLHKSTLAIDSIVQLTNTVKTDISHDKIADNFNDMEFDIPSLDESNNAWETLLIDVKATLNYANDLGIGGASNYLAELEKLIVYGKSINAIQINIAQEQSRFVDLLIIAQVNQNQKARVSGLISQIESDQSVLTHLEQYFHRALNNLKRPLFVALKNYQAAFKYWGLKSSSVIPSLNKSYLDYRSDLATLKEEYAKVLSSFSPSPQDFHITNIEITDPYQLADFAADAELSVNIPLNHPSFSRFDRVRVDTVRVVLEGYELPKGDYYFYIESNGEYQDRFLGTNYTFNANPLYRLFSYELDSNGGIHISCDGSVADEFSYAYFEPTPFSTWTITLDNYNEDILNKVEKIRLEFEGNGIP